MANRLYSEIDTFFNIKFNPEGQREHGKCKFCPNLIITGHGTANYWHHIKNSHESAYNQYKNPRNINNTDNYSTDYEEMSEIQLDADVINRKRVRISEMGQLKIDFPATSVSKLIKFQQLTAEVFAKLGLPHNLIENDDFRELFIEYEKLKCEGTLRFASLKQHRRLILSTANQLFNEIIQTLQHSSSYVTLAVDGWTGQAYGAKNTNIIALCSGKSYLLWSDRNSDDTDGTENYLFPLIKDKIQFLISKSIAVCAITTDNARNMLNIGKELYKLPNTGPVILHLSCSAHTIQLMLQDIVQMEPINCVIQNTLSIIEPFLAKNGKYLRLELRNSQISAGKPPLKLVIFNQTRWLSRFQAIKRLIQLKSHIKWVIVNNSINNLAFIQQESFWIKLESVILPLLNAFQLATNMVQQDSATLLTLDQALTGIRQALNAAQISEHLNVTPQSESSFKFAANELINNRIQSYVLANGCHYAFWAVSLLTDKKLTQWQSSFGDSIKDYNETISWTTNWGADVTLFYENHFPIHCSRDKTAIVSTINRQIAEFESGLASFSTKQQYLGDFTQLIPKNSVDFDPNNPEKREINWILFWSKMRRVAPELSNVACCLLSLGISEAACERSFSIQQLTHSKLRNRLNSDVVEAEMVIRFNKSVFDDCEAKYDASDSD